MEIKFWQDRDKKIINHLIFSKDAETLSKKLAQERGKNKRTQLRRFYDEVLRYDQDAKTLSEDKWPNVLARLHLLIAKAAYALGRELVSDDFVKFIRNAVGQISTKEDLAIFANFFEAFMGFYKLDRPKD